MEEAGIVDGEMFLKPELEFEEAGIADGECYYVFFACKVV